MTKIRPPTVRYVPTHDTVAVPLTAKRVNELGYKCIADTPLPYEEIEYSEVEPRHIWEEEIGEEAARYATREE